MYILVEVSVIFLHERYSCGHKKIKGFDQYYQIVF